MVSGRSGDDRTLLVYLASFAQIAFFTAVYWLVGTTPEENHSRKAEIWARIGFYRWAAWHYRKYLQYSDDSFGHASLGWCYGNLGLNAAAVQQFRFAYVKSKRPDVACSLACAELDEGHVANARFLAAEIAERSHELSPAFVPQFGELQQRLSTADEGQDQRDLVCLDPSPETEQPSRGWRRLARALTRGCLVFAAGVVVVSLPVVLWRSGTPQQVVQLFTLALAGGVLFGVTLLLCHAPILGLMRVAFGARLNRIHTGLLGGVLGFGSMVVFVAGLAGLTDEPLRLSDVIEPFRSPASLLGLVPFVAGGLVFAVGFTRIGSGRSAPERSSGSSRD